MSVCVSHNGEGILVVGTEVKTIVTWQLDTTAEWNENSRTEIQKCVAVHRKNGEHDEERSVTILALKSVPEQAMFEGVAEKRGHVTVRERWHDTQKKTE